MLRGEDREGERELSLDAPRVVAVRDDDEDVVISAVLLSSRCRSKLLIDWEQRPSEAVQHYRPCIAVKFVRLPGAIEGT